MAPIGFIQNELDLKFLVLYIMARTAGPITFLQLLEGVRNSQICESSLPYSVRMHCDENLVKVNEALRREAQVRSQVSENQDGTCTLKLDFNDETTPLLHLELLVPERKQADTMAQCFQDEPTDFYRQIIQLLTQRNGSQNS